MVTKKMQMREQVLEGRPVSAFDIFDCHTHLGYWHNFNVPWRSAADMVRAMDISGIRCCVSAAHAGISTDYRQGNSQVISAMKEFPGRIHGYCCINPHYPHEMLDELKRCFEAGMIAVKVHPSMHRYPVNGDSFVPMWEFADERGLCLLSHTWFNDSFCGPDLFDELAKQYPNVKILLGHSGFGYEGGRKSIEISLKHSNVFLDITSSASFRGLLERLVDGVGADKVLFGTDLPFMDCRPQVGRVAFSALDDEQMALVLGENMRRLFGV